MKQELFSALMLSTLFSAQICAMPEANSQDSGIEPYEEQEIYGNVVIQEKTGVTRFIDDIITGCLKKWDEQKFLDIVQEHIADGVRINRSCREGRTPLMYACWFEAPFCVIRILVEAGGSVRRSRDREGRTALRYACQPKFPRYDVIKLLLDTGARADVADHDGGVPVDYVWRNPNADQRVKDLLLEHYRAELRHTEYLKVVRAELARRDAQEREELPEPLEEKESCLPVIMVKRIE